MSEIKLEISSPISNSTKICTVFDDVNLTHHIDAALTYRLEEIKKDVMDDVKQCIHTSLKKFYNGLEQCPEYFTDNATQILNECKTWWLSNRIYNCGDNVTRKKENQKLLDMVIDMLDETNPLGKKIEHTWAHSGGYRRTYWLFPHFYILIDYSSNNGSSTVHYKIEPHNLPQHILNMLPLIPSTASGFYSIFQQFEQRPELFYPDATEFEQTCKLEYDEINKMKEELQSLQTEAEVRIAEQISKEDYYLQLEDQAKQVCEEKEKLKKEKEQIVLANRKIQAMMQQLEKERKELEVEKQNLQLQKDVQAVMEFDLDGFTKDFETCDDDNEN